MFILFLKTLTAAYLIIAVKKDVVVGYIEKGT